MKIVVLDSCAVTPGDLDWSGLAGLGAEVVTYPHTTDEQAAARFGDAEFAILNKVFIGDEVLRACPNLRWVGVTATGIDSLDIEACRRAGVAVANVPSYSTESVAQMTWALALELCQCPGRHDAAVRDGRWKAGPAGPYGILPAAELAGKTLGVLGFGEIGRRVSAIGQAFGMHIVSHTRTVREEYEGLGVEFVGLDELFARADVLSLHCPATPDTKGVVNARTLALMRPGARIVNTARGALVDEAAVRDALCGGKLAGYAADVMAPEPIRADSPLLAAPNTILTPHIAWTTPEALARLSHEVCENLRAFLRGEMRNIVNG